MRWASTLSSPMYNGAVEGESEQWAGIRSNKSRPPKCQAVTNIYISARWPNGHNATVDLRSCVRAGVMEQLRSRIAVGDFLILPRRRVDIGTQHARPLWPPGWGWGVYLILTVIVEYKLRIWAFREPRICEIERLSLGARTADTYILYREISRG